MFEGVANPSASSLKLLNIHRQSYLYNVVTEFLQQNKDKAIKIEKDAEFKMIKLFQNSKDVLLNVIQEET